jgi:phenylpropionate dioxygenase-like ring-hydroxylating dioxygenase large terminal subunit
MTTPLGVSEIIARLAETAGAPLSRAKTMASELYHSSDLYDREIELIFKRGWLCAGTVNEIPSAGDYITYSIADKPIYVMRDSDGHIRAFSNVCLHRMMKLLDGRRGTCRRVVCPYHGWTYNNKGQLIGAGHMAQTANFNKAEFKLPEVRLEIWEGWIYVTLDSSAPSVAVQLAELYPIVSAYGMAGYRPVAERDHIWQTNWKLLCENFMEGYHLPVAHKATVGAWFPAEETRFPEQTFDGFTYQTFVKDETATYGRAHPDNSRLKNEWRYTSIMPTVFPSHMYVLAPDHMWYLSLRPKNVNEVHVRFGASLAPEVLHALGDQREIFIKDLVNFFDRVNEEDRFLVEGLQQGSASGLASPGPLSWLERELHDFSRYLYRRLSKSD